MAIPTLEERVSPVFDVAQSVIVVQLNGERELRRHTLALHSPDLTRRVAALTEQAVDVLICGAVSRPLEALLSAAGVRVISQTCGPVEDVLRGFITGRLSDGAFLMPGCCGRRRQCRRGAPGSPRSPGGPGRRRARRGNADGTGRSTAGA